MDASSLKTASTYLNNLLLARGLLRTGKPVDFAELATPKGKKDDPSANSAVTAQVINLVHDLILRRDVRASIPISQSFKNALEPRH